MASFRALLLVLVGAVPGRRGVVVLAILAVLAILVALVVKVMTLRVRFVLRFRLRLFGPGRP